MSPRASAFALFAISALSAALLAACGDLLGVEPLSGDVDSGLAEGGTVDASAPPHADAEDGGTACDASAAWDDSSGGVVPPGAVGAVPLGDVGIVIYVCRAASGSDEIPGKLLPGYGCYYGDGNQEDFESEYQVLVPAGCATAWQTAFTGILPVGAFVCGHDSQGDLYACRVQTPEVDYGELGHVGLGTNHECVYSLSGLSLTTTDFDILTLD